MKALLDQRNVEVIHSEQVEIDLIKQVLWAKSRLAPITAYTVKTPARQEQRRVVQQ